MFFLVCVLLLKNVSRQVRGRRKNFSESNYGSKCRITGDSRIERCTSELFMSLPYENVTSVKKRCHSKKIYASVNQSPVNNSF